MILSHLLTHKKENLKYFLQAILEGINILKDDCISFLGQHLVYCIKTLRIPPCMRISINTPTNDTSLFSW